MASKKKLETCHPFLQVLFNEVLGAYDHTIAWGHRGKEAQEKAFVEKKTKLHYPDSTHNKLPSEGVDAFPYDIEMQTIDWKYLPAFYHFAGYVRATADEIIKHDGWKVKLRWGGDWDNDFNLKDQTFNDLGHFQVEDI